MPAEGCNVSRTIVVIGGGALSPRAVAAARATDAAPGAAPVAAPVAVLAADSGYDHAVAAGLQPTMLVGDLDSITAHGRAAAERNGTPVHAHPALKDATDTELTIAAALALPDTTELLVVGGTGANDQRLDHLLGTLLALGAPELAALHSVRAVLGTTEIAVVHGGRRADLPLAAGTTFSLLALHGAARGVYLKGAQWELIDATLTPYEARGVSNSALGPVVAGCAEGVLTVVVP
jgi:thiamine pyrophosphokinase